MPQEADDPEVQAMLDAILVARDMHKAYRHGRDDVVALSGVSVSVTKGELVAVMGPPASGKSTLIHCLAGFDAVTSGTVVLDGQQISGMKESELARLRQENIGFVFQSLSLVSTLTVQENIDLPSNIARRTIDPDFRGAIVDAFGLSDLMQTKPDELSSGQQQLAACARALISGPKIVLADEPTGNLDPFATGQVLAALRRAVTDLERAALITTSDPEVAAAADRVIVLSAGKVAAELMRPDREQILEVLRAARRDSAGENGESWEPLTKVSELPSRPAIGVSGSRERGDLSTEQAEVVSRAQRILDSLPGAVAPSVEPGAESLTKVRTTFPSRRSAGRESDVPDLGQQKQTRNPS